MHFSAKNKYLFAVDLGKISICGDKTVTECHRKNRGVFQLVKKVTFRRILAFCSSRKRSHFGITCGSAQCALVGWWDWLKYGSSVVVINN